MLCFFKLSERNARADDDIKKINLPSRTSQFLLHLVSFAQNLSKKLAADYDTADINAAIAPLRNQPSGAAVTKNIHYRFESVNYTLGAQNAPKRRPPHNRRKEPLLYDDDYGGGQQSQQTQECLTGQSEKLRMLGSLIKKARQLQDMSMKDLGVAANVKWTFVRDLENCSQAFASTDNAITLSDSHHMHDVLALCHVLGVYFKL